MACMNHELRNRQQRARDSQRIEFEDERNQRLIDDAWMASRSFSTKSQRKRPDAPRCKRPSVGSKRAGPKMLFHGTSEELKHMLRAAKVKGTWTSGLHRVWTLRCSDGSLLNWAEGSGKLWLQGPPEAVSKLELRVRKGLKNWARR